MFVSTNSVGSSQSAGLYMIFYFFLFCGVNVLRRGYSIYFEDKTYFKDHYKADKWNPPDLHLKSPPEAASIRKRFYLSLQRAWVQSPTSLLVMWFFSHNEGLKCGSGTSSAPSPEPSCSDTHLKIDMHSSS